LPHNRSILNANTESVSTCIRRKLSAGKTLKRHIAFISEWNCSLVPWSWYAATTSLALASCLLRLVHHVFTSISGNSNALPSRSIVVQSPRTQRAWSRHPAGASYRQRTRLSFAGEFHSPNAWASKSHSSIDSLLQIALNDIVNFLFSANSYVLNIVIAGIQSQQQRMVRYFPRQLYSLTQKFRRSFLAMLFPSRSSALSIYPSAPI